MKGLPRGNLTAGPFRNEHVNMGIPFQVMSKRVENTDHTKLELFLLVKRQSPQVENNETYRLFLQHRSYEKAKCL